MVRNGDRFVAQVDFAWPGLKVAVEAVGRAYHEGQWERDVARTNALRECGWIVIFVTWEDLHLRPRETLMSIARALGITFWGAKRGPWTSAHRKLWVNADRGHLPPKRQATT